MIDADYVKLDVFSRHDKLCLDDLPTLRRDAGSKSLLHVITNRNSHGFVEDQRKHSVL